MNPDTTKIWTPGEVRASVSKILVESLGVDESVVTDDAALVRDLGAESIDFLDMSFKCQQAFGVDLPVRLIQDRQIEWRELGVLAKVVRERYGLDVASEELRTIAPSTIPAVLGYLSDGHGLAKVADEERALAQALARRMLADLEGTALDLEGLTVEQFAGYLGENLHSPAAVEAILNRFTVRAVTTYILGQLAAVSRLQPGA